MGKRAASLGLPRRPAGAASAVGARASEASDGRRGHPGGNPDQPAGQGEGGEGGGIVPEEVENRGCLSRTDGGVEVRTEHPGLSESRVVWVLYGGGGVQRAGGAEGGTAGRVRGRESPAGG